MSETKQDPPAMAKEAALDAAHVESIYFVSTVSDGLWRTLVSASDFRQDVLADFASLKNCIAKATGGAK